MEDSRKLFKIYFRPLLCKITRILGWLEPLYECVTVSHAIAFGVLRYGNFSDAKCLEWARGQTIEDSKEDAAEQVVRFLVAKERFRKNDVNAEAKEKHKKVYDYFCSQTKELKGLLGGLEMGLASVGVQTQPGQYAHSVSIDFDGLLEKIMEHFSMARTAPLMREATVGGYDLSFALYNIGTNWLIDWLIGDVPFI